MSVCRKELSKWLRKHPYWNRDKLADFFNVSKKTVYNWTSGSSAIPKKHQEALVVLMDSHPLLDNIIPGEITIEVTAYQYDKFQKAAAIMGMDVKEWITFAASRHADITIEVQEDLKKEQKTKHFRVTVTKS